MSVSYKKRSSHLYFLGNLHVLTRYGHGASGNTSKRDVSDNNLPEHFLERLLRLKYGSKNLQ